MSLNSTNQTYLSRRAMLLSGAASLAGFHSSGIASDIKFPQRQIRLVAPYAPGGVTDTLARLIATDMAGMLGQPVIVENKTGAGGNIGAEAVAKSPADGYTLLMGAGSVSINQTLFPDIPFDILKDLQPISILAKIPNVLVVSSSLPVNNFAEFLEYLRANPKTVNYGTPGIGSVSHLATALMLTRAGLKAEHVAYRGTVPAAAALMSGEVQFVLDNLPPLSGLISSGRLRVLAVATPTRLSEYPTAPAIAESKGLSDYQAVSWQCLLAPSAVPKDIIQLLYTAVAHSLKQQAMIERLKKIGAQPAGLSPEQSSVFLKSEVEKWGAVVRQLNLKVS